LLQPLLLVVSSLGVVVALVLLPIETSSGSLIGDGTNQHAPKADNAPPGERHWVKRKVSPKRNKGERQNRLGRKNHVCFHRRTWPPAVLLFVDRVDGYAYKC
ncbi:unnamed protein product, partial [Ectocarpus sp. 12 AP-2014]